MESVPPTTGLAWSMNTQNVHSYYKIVTRINEDGAGITEKLQVDELTYQNLAPQTRNFVLKDGSKIVETVSKETKTYYDFEMDQNEKKRTIKLLKPEFVSELEKEFKRVIKE
jgi:hypothetical protein